MSKKANEIAKELGLSGYDFNGGQIMSEGWKLGLSIAGWALLYAIMYYFFQFIASIIPLIGPLGFGLVVGPSLSAGLILFIHHKYTTGESDFGRIFKGFQFIGQIILSIILLGLLMFGVIIVFGTIAFLAVGMDSFQELALIVQDLRGVTDPMEIIEIVMSVFSVLLPAFVIMIIAISTTGMFFIFTTHFIVLGGCSATEAIGSSFRIVKKKFWPIFGVLFVIGIVQMISMIPFGLGLILTMPWILGSIYMMFNSIILSKLDEEGPITDSQDILDA